MAQFTKFTTADNLKIWTAWLAIADEEGLKCGDISAKEATTKIKKHLKAKGIHLSRSLTIKKVWRLAKDVGEEFKRTQGHASGRPSWRVEACAMALIDIMECLEAAQNQTEVRALIRDALDRHRGPLTAIAQKEVWEG